MRVTWTSLCLAAAFGLCALVVDVSDVAANGATLDDQLTDRDRSRLARGELVTRRTSEQRGSLNLIGGTSWQVANVPIAHAWRAMHDVGRFAEMLPGASESRATFRQGTDRGVFMRHTHGPVDATYHLRLSYIEPSKVVMFQLDDRQPSAFRAGWGFFRIQPWADNRTLVSFGVLADFGTGVISGALRPRLHHWLLRVPETTKSYLERSARQLAARRSAAH